MNIRLAQPKDWPLIKANHDWQNKRDNTRYPLPQFFDEQRNWARNIHFALVAERYEEVVSCVYFEKCAEMCFAGTDPEATAMLQREITGARYALKQDGVESLHTLVPRGLAGTKKKPRLVAKPLMRAGFVRDDDALAHFYMDLRGNQ